MDIDCPSCGKNSELDSDDLPHDACDHEEYECKHCEVAFNIGWYATAEVRL
jgi:predicted  nucleic acid-binding Zn ribbon protein